MILMAVRYQQTPDPVDILFQIGCIGYHQIDAQHLFRWERTAAVDYDDILPILNRGHVLANFANTTERYDFQF
ncbi:hypothetical protein SDC9_212529 [bioreactor metagenome]|uniref:Uncharacterized protein n=1 Tax=bioreactor metagenome TaxID=1076179 RepID=A0A645JN94_9ZZZZ